MVGAVIWVYVHKLVKFWQQELEPSNWRDLQGHRANTPALHFCFVFGGNSRPFLLPQSTLTISQNESFPPNTLHYITVQLFALSLRRSVATAARSGRLGICEMRLVERADLLRLMFLLFLFTQASVATWKMSRTLFSDCTAEHSI